MGTRETVTQSQRFYCVSLTPDLCKTPVGSATPPLPYTIKGEFSQATSVSPNVKSQGAKVMLHGKSTVPSTTGDSPGSAGGVKSGTTGSKVETKDFSSTVTSNVKSLVREGDTVWMNSKNTIGKVYERGVKGAKDRISDLGDAANATLGEAKEAAKPYAQHYKDNVSASLHEAGKGAMEVGGKIGIASGGVALAGAGVAATGVGLPVAAAMEATAAAGGTVAAVTTGVGAATETGATIADKVADYVLTGKAPDVVGTATQLATNLAESVVMKKLGGVGGKLTDWAEGMGKKLFGAKPGKAPAKAPAPPPPSSSKDGSKHQAKKEAPADKPATCCAKGKAPGGKAVGSRRPVHYGTGEEILEETDFVSEGASPLAWTRVYRSGSEAEDWGLLGARWATPYTTSISAHRRGIVVHEATGRALRLPPLAPGQQHDHAAEGFTLRCDSHDRFTLIWRSGATDTFVIGEGADRQGWLPHGHDGVNAMLQPDAPLRVLRYTLRRSQRRDGVGHDVERFSDAVPGGVLVRIRSDDGRMLEALREAAPADDGLRIGAVDEMLADGTRITRARYRYDSEMRPDTTLPAFALTAAEALPLRHNLVEQANALGQSRHYRYRHHLLVGYTTFGGFAHGLEWIGLAALQRRWAGDPATDDELAQRHPIRLDDSYRARAVRTFTQDGTEEVRIAYATDGVTRVTEPGGAQLEYRFNARWLATEVFRVRPDGTLKSLGKSTWSSDDQLVAETDASGTATRYRYDNQNRVTCIEDASGHMTRLEYGEAGLPVTIIDALGQVTRRTYDGAGRVTSVTDALEHTTRYHHDANGRLVQVQDAKGGVKTFVHDAAGRLMSHTDCSGHTTRHEYDAQGRLTATVTADGATTRHQHDELGRLVRIVHPAPPGGVAPEERFSYDADGNLAGHVDPTGGVTRFRYNGQGQPVERIDANGEVLRYRYDTALRLVELTNAAGQRHALTYDTEGRLVGESDFEGRASVYAYDDDGWLIADERNGRRTSYLRDAMGRLVAHANADGVVRYAHDALGRLAAAVSPHAEHRFVHDAAHRLIEERTRYTLDLPEATATGVVPARPSAAFVLRHAYDELGNRIHTTLPNGRRVDTLRYGSGHWHGTLWQGQSVADVERDTLHRETGRQIGIVRPGDNRLTEQRRYDPQSRLAARRVSLGGHVLHDRLYSHDAAGHLLRIDDSAHGITRYTHDPAGRLLRAEQPHLTETFAFDPAGHLLAGDDTATRPAEAGAAQLAPLTDALLKRCLNTTHEHDTHGNTVLRRTALAGTGGELVLRYDDENRLVEAVHRPWGATDDTPAWSTSRYVHDAWGRRIAKQVTRGTGTPCDTTLFVWDGDVMVQEVRSADTLTYLHEPDSFVPLARVLSAGGVDQFATERVHLWHEPSWDLPGLPDDARAQVAAWQQHQRGVCEARHHESLAAWDALAARTATADRVDLYDNDHLGTPQRLLDASGRVVWSARYRAWGEIVHADGDGVPQPLRFQGQYADDETGLHYNRHRCYDPQAGAYLTADPSGLRGGLNAHAYVAAPTSFVDPLGLSPTPAACKKAPSGRFTTHDAAAKAAILRYNDKSIRDNLEYGGVIYKTPDGRFDYTKAIKGTTDGVNPWDPSAPQPPGCAVEAGYWHTHGDHSDASGKRTTKARDAYDSNNFSPQDKDAARQGLSGYPDYRGYVGTPTDGAKGYDPKTNRVYRL